VEGGRGGGRRGQCDVLHNVTVNKTSKLNEIMNFKTLEIC